MRGWEVLSACCGLFAPSAKLLKVVASFLMLAETNHASEVWPSKFCPLECMK